MNKFYNIFSKIVIILALATGWGGSAWAQNPVKNICATFNNPSGNTAWGNVVITPNASDASENINSNVAITVNGTTALKAPVNALTSEFLGPNQQTSTAGVGGTYTFTITGLPVGSSFDKIALPLKAVNAGGSNQGVNTFMVNVAISVTDGTSSLYQTTLNDVRLQNSTSGEVHENISATPATSIVTNTGRLEVSFTITKGTTNPGCFMAFHGLNLTTEIELDPNRFNLQLSDAPSAVDWASNTHWYTIRLASNNGYMSQGADYLDNGYMKSNVTTKPSDDAGKWCFVASGSNNRVYIYNKESGVGKVLSIDNTNNNEKLYMMDKDAATQKAHDWSYVASNSAPGYFFWHYNAGVVERSFTTNSNHFVTAWSGGLGSVTGASNLNKFIIEECVEDYPTFDIDESKYSFEPKAGRVTKRQDFQLKLTVEGKTIVSCTELNDEGTTVPVVMPRLVSMARASIAATSVTRESDGVYTIHFDGDIDEGNYTLSVPSGVFYVKDGEDVQKMSNMSVDYILLSPAAATGYLVTVKKEAGDATDYAVTTSAGVASGRNFAYDGEHLDLSNVPDLKDLQSLTINAPANKFVWGPVVDNTAKTITFEVRTAIKSIDELTDGFYQLQMTDDANITRYNSIAKPFNTKSKYVYVAPWYTQSEYQNDYANKYTGVPSYAGAPSTFYYLSKSGSNVRVQSVYGHYFSRLNTPNRDPQNITSIEYNTTNNTLSFDGWTKEGYWTSNNSNGTEGPRAAAASGKMEHYHVSKVDLSDYEVYRVNIEGWAAGANIQSDPRVTYKGEAGNNYGLPTVYHNGYFFFEKGYQPVSDDFTSAGAESITVDPDTKTINVVLPVPTIIHRQHALFNQLAAATDKPSNKFIQEGQGLIDHPNASEFTDERGYTANDRKIQNTSVFHITQYAEKGGTTSVALPHTRTGGLGKVNRYQRWYDYETERPLKDGILQGLSGYTLYTNGIAKKGVTGSVTITLPSDKDEIFIGVDDSEFNDFSTEANGDLREPSLSMRTIIHIISAEKMVSSLVSAEPDAQGNLIPTGEDKWVEEKTYIVPNVKRGSRTHYNNVDLLPLDMPFSNYWISNGNGGLMRVVAENGNNNTQNLLVKVEGTAKEYIEADIFRDNSTGIGNPLGVRYNHFVYYKFKGDELTRSVPAGSQAIIKVYGRNGVSGTPYQLAKFTLNFHEDCEPLAITSVIGDESSTRSREYFKSQQMAEVASLTFAEKKADFKGFGGVGNYATSYAFPLNPTRTSYAFSPDDAYGGYRITKKGYGMKALPVSVYEHNIMNKDAAYIVTGETVAEIPDDYYLYIDAAESPGQVASIPLDGNLCPGSRLFFYGWLNSQNPYEYTTATSASVILELVGIKDSKEKVLATYLPGVISDAAYTSEGELVRSVVGGIEPSSLGAYSYSYGVGEHTVANRLAAWQSIGFSYLLAETGFDSYELRIINNCFSTAGGDYSLDDFRVFVKKPSVEVRDAAPVCGSSLDLVRITTDYDALMEVIKGNSSVNPGSTGSGTKAYYGVYAVLDKTEYMKKLGEKQNPTTSDLAEAFMASIVGDTNADNCLYDDDNNAATPDVLDKSLYAFHTIKFYDQFDAHAVVTYSDLINSEEREVAGRFMQGESKSLVFNCKFEDEGLKGGDDYMLVFAIQADEAHTHISGKSGADYVNYFDLDGDCRIVHEFTPSSATMVRIDGAQGVNPYKIDYCPGSAPNVTLNSYSYDINTGKLVQEVGVEYDWYYGTLKDYREKKIHGSDGVDHTLDEALMNFRIFYPDVNETDLSTCTPQGPTAVNSIDYTLTQSMIDMIKTEVEAGTLKLRKTNALFEIDKVDGDDAAYTVVAIKLGNRVTSKEDEDGTTHYFVYCAEPVELKFYTNHETPAAAVGLADVTYVGNTPYNVRDKKGNLISVPTRINQTQVRELISKSKKTYLRLPIDVMVPSGYYKSDVDDGHGGKIPQTTDMVRFLLDPTNTDVVVAETNDPQWQLYDVSGTEIYMPVVGKLKEISARKQRKLFTWLTGNGKEDSGDLLGIDFSDPTIQRTFIPREGYYYVLRARFLEEADGYDVSEDDPEYDPSLKEQFKFHKSPLFDTSQVMRCPGTILIPLKIVPEYMKWTGRESTDWNNDRNWIRADYSDLVPSEEQNATNAYNGYPVNTTETEGTAYNGLPLPTNDQVVRQSDPDKKFEGLDIYIPMEEGVETSETSSPYSFGYAPTEHTSVIIPSGLTHYPALKAHAKGTDAAQKGLLLLNQDSEEENTSIIEYDMVAVTANGNYLGSSFYEAKPYYENTVKDITFEPGATMYGAEHLNYRKAWVEYSLPTDQWTALASPLQETYAGEWYAPTEGAQQRTPQFMDITYSTALNNRFAPAFYQRSWDKSQAKVYRMPEDGMAAGVADRITESGKIDNVAVSLDWSHVYNDVTVNYSAGGFSVKPVAPDAVGGKTLVRMPKADTSYDYYDQSGSYNGDHTAITRTAGKHNRLFSDLVKNGGSFTQVVENANEEDGMSYFLVANPFMTAMDMDKFFDGNDQFERKFWTPDGKTVSVQSEQGWQSIAADMTGQQVQPLTSFFVRGAGKTATVKYNAQMQAAPADGSSTATSAMLYMIAEQKGEVKSTAAVACGEGYSAEFSEQEDGQLLIDEAQDENLCRVFTMAGGQALQINATNGTKAIPLGILAAEGVETSVTFSGVDAIGTEGEAQLYDAVEQTYVPLTEDTTLSVMGSSLGRYYILTGIQQAEETLDETTGECYDLQGLRINTIRHGQIYIQNHKRILAR